MKKGFWMRMVVILLFGLFLLFYLNEKFIYNNHSDMEAHFRFALNIPLVFELGLDQFGKEVSYAHIISYPGWHLLFDVIYTFLSRVISSDMGETTILLAQALENSGLLVVTFVVMEKCMQKYYHLTERVSVGLAIINMFIGPLFIPGISQNYYLGQFTANPWHNPTILMIKPLAVFTFFLYCYLVQERSKSENFKKQNILFVVLTLCLLFGAWMKPSFYQAFVPALFVFCIVDLIKTKGASLKFDIKTGFAVLPVCVLALIQYIVSFDNTENGIIWAPGCVWESLSDNIGLSFFLSMAFPLFILILSKGKMLKSVDGLLSVLFFLTSFGMFACLSFSEHGDYGDFLWAVYLAVLMLFIVFEKYLLELGKGVKLIGGSVLLGMHFVCGVLYFVMIYIEGTFRL